MARLRLGDWFGLLFFVAILYVLVRPQSNAAQLIQYLGSFLKALVSSATDTAK